MVLAPGSQGGKQVPAWQEPLQSFLELVERMIVIRGVRPCCDF